MLLRKMLRDIGEYKVQFISVFLMAFIGVFIFAGISGEALCLEENIDHYYEDTNLADGWIYSFNINELFLYQVDCLGATDQMERQMVVDSIANYDNESEITLHFVENNTISKFYLLEGKRLNIYDEDGVWLDKTYADAKGLKVGDNVTFEFGDYRINKEIKGLGYSPEYVYHLPESANILNLNKNGFAYMSYKAFPEDTVPYNVLNVKFDGEPDTFEDLLSYRLGGYYSSFVEQQEHASVREFQSLVSQFNMIAKIMPAVFIFISMLILLTTIKRIITHQRTQIGILKASGFNDRRIIIHYLSYGIILILAGSILGLITGPIFMYALTYYPIGQTFKLPYLDPVGGINFAYVAVLMVLLSVMVSLSSIKSIVKEDPSTIIRPKVPKATTSTFIEKLKFWNHASFNIRWNYRDAKRNKFRAVMTIIGVLGCTVLLISAFGLAEGLSVSEHWQHEKINHFESKLVVEHNATTDQINNVAKDISGDEIMETQIEIESDFAKKSASLLVLNDTDLITPTDIHQNEIEIADDEISISKRMADLLEVDVGDTVTWHIEDSDKWVNVTIDKIHGHPTSQGLVMSQDKLNELGLNFTPTSIITSKHVDKDYDGIKSTIHKDELKKTWNELNRPIWITISSLTLFAIILAAVVLYNLGLLTFLEMERDIGTLKVLGFKTLTITKLLMTQSIVYILIGGLLGIPIGHDILSMVWKSSSETYFTVARVSPMNLLFTFMIIFTVSIIINIHFLRQIKKLDMVDTLKIIE